VGRRNLGKVRGASWKRGKEQGLFETQLRLRLGSVGQKSPDSNSEGPIVAEGIQSGGSAAQTWLEGLNLGWPRKWSSDSFFVE